MYLNILTIYTKRPITTAMLSSLIAIFIQVSYLIVLAPQQLQALENGLARTPPMGWLAWERFVCETDCRKHPDDCIGEELFMKMAERLDSDGFKRLGYTYINIDDCWSKRERSQPNGKLEPDPEDFPSGLKALADYIHKLGLRLGIYGDCGTKTCQLYPGQLAKDDSLAGNYFQLDAKSFAEWGIDSFKFDGCYMNVSLAAHLCPFMGDSLNATGRPMLFSCSWPAYEFDEKLETNWSLVQEKCNLWRSFGDIEDSWSSVLYTVDYFVQMQATVVKYHGPGHWFDADQLVIGNFGLSHDQERAQMALWCVWASPLYMSNDLRRLSKSSTSILQNKLAIQVNQDPMGIFGLMVRQSRNKEQQAFVKPVEPVVGGCPSYAVVYLNRRTLGGGQLISVLLRDLLINTHEMLTNFTDGQYKEWIRCSKGPARFGVIDLFDEDDHQKGDNSSIIRLDDSTSLDLLVNPSGIRMVKLVRMPDEHFIGSHPLIKLLVSRRRRNRQYYYQLQDYLPTNSSVSS